MKSITDILNFVLEVSDVARSQVDSLKKELVYMRKYTSASDVLQSKENQINRCENLMAGLNEIFDSLYHFSDLQFKLEACAYCHGVSLGEINYFINRSSRSIDKDVFEVLREGFVTVPEIIRPLIDVQKSDAFWNKWLENKNSETLVMHLERDLNKISPEKLTGIDPDPKPVKFSNGPLLPFEVLQKMSGKQFVKV